MKVKKPNDSVETELKEEFDDENIADVDPELPEVGKRKATEFDKERKREKNRLKRQRKKLKKQTTKTNQELPTFSRRNQVITYLNLWENDKEKWKFNKKSQAWMLQNLYSKEQIEGQEFETLLKYLVGLNGEVRNRVIKEAETIVGSSEDETNVSKTKRAREILQILG